MLPALFSSGTCLQQVTAYGAGWHVLRNDSFLLTVNHFYSFPLLLLHEREWRKKRKNETDSDLDQESAYKLLLSFKFLPTTLFNLVPSMGILFITTTAF